LPTYEVIYLIAKPKFKLAKGANKYGDVWEFKQEMKNKHPAPFPVPLIDRIISSTNAEIILDPFMGSGTTAITALGNDRKFIGIDISPDYCEMARERIEKNLRNSEVKNLKAQYKLQFNMNIYTKEKLIEKLTEISNAGWIENQRHGNQGGIGNTLEHLLGIEENNLPIPKLPNGN